MIEYPFLQCLLVPGYYVQSIVDIIEIEAVKSFKEYMSVFISMLFRAGIERSAENEQAEYLIDTVLHVQLAALPVPELVYLKLLVEFFQDAISDILKIVFISRHNFAGIYFDDDLGRRFLFLRTLPGDFLEMCDRILIFLLEIIQTP